MYTTEQRKEWMRLLALAPDNFLKNSWEKLEGDYQFNIIRQPEIGLVMIQARSGGDGAPFNCGEMPVSRCAIRHKNIIGHGYKQGRKKDEALYMAIFDAMLQDTAWHQNIKKSVLNKIDNLLQKKKSKRYQDIKKTKVDFFTMVRGEDI